MKRRRFTSIIGLAEIYSTPTDGFHAGASFGNLHPIHIEAALNDLEQDVEAELRRRGHKFIPESGGLRTCERKAGTWAVTLLDYRPNKQDLDLPVEVIVDRIESEIAK